MKTNRLISSAIIFFCLVTVSFGQTNQRSTHKKGKGTVEDRINKRLDKMDEVVKFTGNQRNDMKALMTDFAKKKKDAFCANEIGTDGMKNAMKAIRKEKIDGAKKILTSDQMKLWKDFMKEQKKSRKNKNQNNKEK